MIFRIDNLLKYIKSRFPVVPGVSAVISALHQVVCIVLAVYVCPYCLLSFIHIHCLTYSLAHLLDLTVCAGDLILTGTPAGVSPIRAGDRVVAQVLSPGGGKVLSQGSWDVVQGQ